MLRFFLTFFLFPSKLIASRGFFKHSSRLFASIGIFSIALLSSTAIADNSSRDDELDAEILEIYTLMANDWEAGLSLLNQRIVESDKDSKRKTGLYIFKGFNFRDHGPEIIDDVLVKVLPLINKDQDPVAYLYAMSLKAFNMYTYKNQKQQAADLLESLQDHPELNNDIYLKMNFIPFLLEAYYKTNQSEKVSKPLFSLVQSIRNKKIKPEYNEFFQQIDQELAFHSTQIGDTKEALRIYLRLVKHGEENGLKNNVTIAYCNIANMQFLPLLEKMKYAKAGLIDPNDPECLDVMEKLVILKEVQEGNLKNISKLSQISPYSKGLHKEHSAYYAGLAYLHLNDVANAQLMAKKMTDPDNWERFDLLQRIYERQNDYQNAFRAAQRYHQLWSKKDSDARFLMLSSYQARLEIALDEVKAAEKAKQSEQLAATEQKAESRLQLMITVIIAGVLITLVLTLYLYRGRQLRLKLQLLSDTDPLTGLLNRRAFLKQVEQLKQLAQRQHFPLSLAMVDLDFFKQINDKHGHQTGDAVLRAFADASKSTLRQTDILGRFGGEEFIVATVQHDNAAFSALLKRLQQNFTQICLQDKQIGFAVSFSAGIANVITHNVEQNRRVEDAINLADKQLYRAKANGRRQVCTDEFCMELAEVFSAG